MNFTDEQLKLIGEYRYCNVDYEEWASSTIEHALSIVNILQLDVSAADVRFSGFSSQGDGLSFTFYSWALSEVYVRSYELLRAEAMRPEEDQAADEDDAVYKAVLALAADIDDSLKPFDILGNDLYDALGSVTFSAGRIDHQYCHAGTVRVDLNGSVYNSRFADPIEEQLQSAIEAIDIDAHVESIANALYDQLEKEHDCLISDEEVWETIVANDWDKEAA